MFLIPTQVWQSIAPIVVGMIAFYLIQPVVFWVVLQRLCHDNSISFALRAVVFLWFCATMAYLAMELKHRLGVYYKFQVNLIWWLYGLQFAKMTHAVVSPQSLIDTVGLSINNKSSKTTGSDDDKYKKKEILLSWSRLCILCYCPPTVLFAKPEELAKTENGPRRRQQQPRQQVFPYRSATFYVLRGIGQMMVMLQTAHGVLYFQLYNYLPVPLQSILCFYMVCLSQGGFADLFMNAPTRLWIDNTSDATTRQEKLALVEPSDAPCCATHARYFWARWSKNVGTIHFRHALYQHLGGGYTHQYRSTALTFGANCLLHIFFWGPVSTRDNKLAWSYAHVLMLAPAVALLLDKHVFQPCFLTTNSKVQPEQNGASKKSAETPESLSKDRISRFLYRFCNWMTLQVLAALLFPSFLDAQGMPTNLHDLALLQTGQLG